MIELLLDFVYNFHNSVDCTEIIFDFVIYEVLLDFVYNGQNCVYCIETVVGDVTYFSYYTEQDVFVFVTVNFPWTNF